MLELALCSLVHDRGKFVAALIGVALATTLLLVEIGLYVGLVDSSAAIVRRVGGDVWLMSPGTEVVDNGDKLRAGSDTKLRANPCTRSVRSVVISTLPIKKRSGALDYVQVVGVDALERGPIPWALARGAHADLHAPLAVAVDEHDLQKLDINGEPLGATLSVAGTEVKIAALTRGIRAFSLNPYVFTDAANARRIMGAGDGEAQYFVADANDARCVETLLATFKGSPGVDARRTSDFVKMSERYWVSGSGAGGALAFSAIFSLAVGAIIVGQTLYAITKDHVRELATLRAMGGARSELFAFVGWQSSTLAVLGSGIGALLAHVLRALLSRGGIEVALTGEVVGIGAASVALMCALATLPSTLRVLRVGPGEVLR